MIQPFRSVVVLLVVAAFLLPLPSLALYEPRYHIFVPQHWINDPNAPFRDPVTGTIHLYLQYNPYGALWGNMSWYHVTSTDYVTWQRVDQLAMRPDKWYDAGGVFDGTLMYNNASQPVVMYTCVEEGNFQQQCVANPQRSDLAGKRTFDVFDKSPINVVVTQDMVPNIVPGGNFRDPTEWWEDPLQPGRWLIAFSARINNNEGDNAHIVVFSTEDPTFQSGYTFSHSLYQYRYDPDHMFECPDFYKADNIDEYFVKVSTMPPHRDYNVYGSYQLNTTMNEYVFVADPSRSFTFLDYGPHYASKTYFDPILQRRFSWGWTNDELSNAQILQNGWSGVQNVLRQVVYDASEQQLKYPPIGELKALRQSRIASGRQVPINATPTVVVPASSAATIYQEIRVTFTVPPTLFDGSQFFTAENAPEVGVMVRTSADQQQYASVSLKMPVGTQSPVSGSADAGTYPFFKQFSLPSATAVATCEAACNADRWCETWTVTPNNNGDESSCTEYWRASSMVEQQGSTSGTPNVPLLFFGRETSTSIGDVTPLHGRAPLTKATPNQFSLIIYVDNSVIETFKDDGLQTLTGRLYINAGDQLSGVSLYTRNIPDGEVTASYDVFTMGSMWGAPQPPNVVRNFTNALYDLLETLVDV